MQIPQFHLRAPITRRLRLYVVTAFCAVSIVGSQAIGAPKETAKNWRIENSKDHRSALIKFEAVFPIGSSFRRMATVLNARGFWSLKGPNTVEFRFVRMGTLGKLTFNQNKRAFSTIFIKDDFTNRSFTNRWIIIVIHSPNNKILYIDIRLMFVDGEFKKRGVPFNFKNLYVGTGSLVIKSILGERANLDSVEKFMKKLKYIEKNTTINKKLKKHVMYTCCIGFSLKKIDDYYKRDAVGVVIFQKTDFILYFIFNEFDILQSIKVHGLQGYPF